jgi:hypothetical protein
VQRSEEQQHCLVLRNVVCATAETRSSRKSSKIVCSFGMGSWRRECAVRSTPTRASPHFQFHRIHHLPIGIRSPFDSSNLGQDLGNVIYSSFHSNSSTSFHSNTCTPKLVLALEHFQGFSFPVESSDRLTVSQHSRLSKSRTEASDAVSNLSREITLWPCLLSND